MPKGNHLEPEVSLPQLSIRQHTHQPFHPDSPGIKCYSSAGQLPTPCKKADGFPLFPILLRRPANQAHSSPVFLLVPVLQKIVEHTLKRKDSLKRIVQFNQKKNKILEKLICPFFFLRLQVQEFLILQGKFLEPRFPFFRLCSHQNLPGTVHGL